MVRRNRGRASIKITTDRIVRLNRADGRRATPPPLSTRDLSRYPMNLCNCPTKRGRRYDRQKREVRSSCMIKLSERIGESAATGYILLWLLGIPLPILLVIFLL